MAEESMIMPLDFVVVRMRFPADFDKVLGYHGPARFIGFWWDDQKDDVAWDDGISSEVGTGEWANWYRFIAPIGSHFHAELGNSEEPATHLFIWDRAQHFGHIAPKESAITFLKERQGR